MPEAVNAAAGGAGLDALARFAAHANPVGLPADILQKAQACLLYGLAVGVASRATEAPRQAAGLLDFEYGEAPHQVRGATRFIDARRTPPGAAAFANAVLLHARTQEDAHPAGHVGVVVIAAALAIAERVDATGADLLAALAAGYEVALRIGRDHAADASTRGFRTTPLYGVFGAAAASARLLRLDPPAMRNALALAANAACGLREFVIAGTGEFPFHAGFAARNGISAASAAQAAVQAAGSTLEGDAGFYRAFAATDKPYAGRLAEGLGNEWEMRRVTYKPYPTCQFHRSVISGVLALRERGAQRTMDRMIICMHPFEADFVGVRYAGPFQTFSQTFMSAPFCAALAWARGAVGYRGLHAFDDPQVIRHVPLVEVIADPSRPRYQPQLALHYRDGSVDRWEQDADADDFALSWDAAVRMTRQLCREVAVPEAASAALIAAVEGVAGAADVRDVIAAMGVAMGPAQPPVTEV